MTATFLLFLVGACSVVIGWQLAARQHPAWHNVAPLEDTPIYNQLAEEFPHIAENLVTPIQAALVRKFEWEPGEAYDVAVAAAQALGEVRR